MSKGGYGFDIDAHSHGVFTTGILGGVGYSLLLDRASVGIAFFLLGAFLGRVIWDGDMGGR